MMHLNRNELNIEQGSLSWHESSANKILKEPLRKLISPRNSFRSPHAHGFLNTHLKNFFNFPT